MLIVPNSHFGLEGIIEGVDLSYMDIVYGDKSHLEGIHSVALSSSHEK